MPPSPERRLTVPEELLFRQISPAFLKVADQISSQVFRPTSKDSGLLSVDRSSKCTAQDAHERFASLGLRSLGVLGVTVGECAQESLAAFDDPLPDNTAHAVIDFSGLTRGQSETKAKKLLFLAEQRGFCYRSLPDGTDGS